MTPILIADGSYRPIKDVRIGEFVASRNEFTGVYGSNLVTALPGDWHTDRVVVTLEDQERGRSEVITTTLEHPFHVPGHGFVDARHLKAGMAVSRWAPADSPVQMVGLRDADAVKGHLLVKAVTITDKGLEPWRTCNLTVANDHTYFVGETRAWVHNADDCIANIWKLAPTERGRAIEAYLARSEYKDWFNAGQLNNGKFPLIDLQKGTTLVSLKSVDTNGSSWMGDMRDHIVALGKNGATVDGKLATMVLDLRVQGGGSVVAQSLIAYGRQLGVTVVIKEFK